ncbi:MAG: hypothetical protein JWO73_435 [Candidatus Taylorbacteria bacterium]|nr:hypothetical protein [Candidatus Taylorbacteria bacterium]
MKKIAILGGTGYIGKSLVHRLSLEGGFETHVFSRSKEKMEEFARSIGAEGKFELHSLGEFGLHEYDAVINCIGIGNPSVLKKDPSEIMRITEEFDSLVISYLEKHPETLYVNLSSGAVYGKDLDAADPKNNYALAKIHSEKLHRSLPHLNIADLRVFSFFSRFVDLNSGFMISEMIDCARNKKPFLTSREDIVRDYVSPEDLFALMKLLIEKGRVNDFFDVYSLKPISKSELLEFFSTEHALEYRFKETADETSPTGSKNAYYSKDKKAETLGFVPQFTSLECIRLEIDNMQNMI